MFAGLATLDVIQLVDRVPTSDEKVAALNLAIAAGGPATNAAVVFAALGGDAHLVTHLGNDAAGALVREDLTTHGVAFDPNQAVFAAASTTVATIAVTAGTGERAIITTGDQGCPGVGGTPAPDLDPRVRVVLADSYETHLSIPILERAAAAGVPAILDVGRRKDNSPDLLARTTVAIVSRDFDRSRSVPDIFDEIHGYGAPCVVITDGALPIEYSIASAATRRTGVVQPVQVDGVADTLGAGDFFHGSAAYHIARHGADENSLIAALEFASRVTARSVASFGTRAWLAGLREEFGAR